MKNQAVNSSSFFMYTKLIFLAMLFIIKASLCSEKKTISAGQNQSISIINHDTPAGSDQVIGANVKTQLWLSDHKGKYYSSYYTMMKNYKSKTPIILEATWGKVVIQHGKKKIVRIDGVNGIKKACTIFWHGGQKSWNWFDQQACYTNRHHPGYTEQGIRHLLRLEPNITHLILTTGYEDVLRVFGYKRTEVGFLQKVEPKIRKIMEEELGKEKAKNIKLVIGNTIDCIPKYNTLSSDPTNRVVMASHFTC